jgi:hypothetical protein
VYSTESVGQGLLQRFDLQQGDVKNFKLAPLLIVLSLVLLFINLSKVTKE